MKQQQPIVTSVLQPDKFSRLIQKNIAGGVLAKGISIGINLIYVPLLIHYLNAERYGIWIAITSFVSWFQYFDIGIGNGLRNHLTNALAAKDFKSAREMISTSYLLSGIIFGLITLVIFIVSPYMNWPELLNVNNLSRAEIQTLFLIIFSGLSVTFIVQLIQPILFATQKSALSMTFPAISNIVSLALLLIVMQTDAPPLLTAGAILSFSPLITFLAGAVFLFQTKLNYLKPSIRHINFKHASKITGLGFGFFFIQIANVVISSSASIIIIRIAGPAEVTSYNIGYKYLQISTVISGIIATPLWSGFTQKAALGDFKWIKDTINRQNRISLLLTAAIILLTLASPYLIPIWVGPGAGPSNTMLMLLAIYFSLTVFATVYSMFINGCGKIRLSMYFTGVEILVYLFSAYFFSISPLGKYGVVIASILAKSLSFSVQFIQTQKIINQSATGIWNK